MKGVKCDVTFSEYDVTFDEYDVTFNEYDGIWVGIWSGTRAEG